MRALQASAPVYRSCFQTPFNRKLLIPQRSTRTAASAAMAPYTFYTWKTPNGYKASILLEELGLDYETKSIDISTNVQKEDWFLKINPNGRIPAIVDHTNNDLNVFETGSILWYLVEKHDKEGKFWPKDFNKRSEVMSWLMFQMGGIGPMQGQANHFVRFSNTSLSYPIHRYVDETKRLFSALESQLEKHEWLAADQYSIADIATFPWVAFGPVSGIDYKEFPNLAKWVEKIYARPAVKKGLDVPSRNTMYALLDDEKAYKEQLQIAKDKAAKADEAAK